MTSTARLIVLVVAAGALVALLTAAMHEKHYGRRELILLRKRVEAIESILLEDRGV